MSNNIKWLNEKKAQELVQLLLSEEYDTILVNSLEEAKDKIINSISPKEKVIVGDSMVLDQLNIINELKDKSIYVYDYQSEKDFASREEIRRNGLLADTLISEIDFVTSKGELIVHGAFSNAAMLFGPNKIYGIIGINKIVKDIFEAEKKIEELKEAYSLNENANQDKEISNNLGIISHGKKFINKYTLFVVPTTVGF